jgi:hydrogenase maturation protease
MATVIAGDARDEAQEPRAAALSSAPVLVLGLGNPILSDDGAGWHIVAEAERRWPEYAGARLSDAASAGAVRFDCVALGGLALMETLVGCDRAILVDATQTPGGLPGTLYRLELADLPTLHADAVHDASLVDALELGRKLGAQLPQQIAIIAVEAENVLDFGEELSPPIAACLDRAVEMVLAELELMVSPSSRVQPSTLNVQP